MFRRHALCGVSCAALQLALLAPVSVAHAQSRRRRVAAGHDRCASGAGQTRGAQARRASPRPNGERRALPQRPNGRCPSSSSAPRAAASMPRWERRRSSRDSRCRRSPSASRPNRSTRPSISRTRKTPSNTCRACSCESATTATTRRYSRPEAGVSASSARTLIYYDDLLISALIGNNNSGASPHWNLVSPEAIARIDFLNGPFSAAYPGNSIGGVLLITSKMPDHAFAIAKETVSVMPWNQYGTHDTYVTSQTSAAAGNRDGKLSWFVSANHLDSYQQPLTYTTNGSIPAGTTRDLSGAEQAGTCRRRRRHRRAGAFAADVGQFQAGLRRHAAGAGDLFARDLEQRPDLQSRRPI